MSGATHPVAPHFYLPLVLRPPSRAARRAPGWGINDSFGSMRTPGGTIVSMRSEYLLERTYVSRTKRVLQLVECLWPIITELTAGCSAAKAIDICVNDSPASCATATQGFDKIILSLHFRTLSIPSPIRPNRPVAGFPRVPVRCVDTSRKPSASQRRDNHRSDTWRWHVGNTASSTLRLKIE
jgi:hypothetical protein